MESSAEEIRQLVESIVTPLVENADALSVTSNLEEDSLHIDIEVAPEDAGRVIGRQGRLIKSIRTLARAAAMRKNLSVEIELLD